MRGRTPQYLRGTEIVTERLTLKAFQAADAATVFSAIDPTLARFMVWDPPSSNEAFSTTAQDWEARIAAGTDLPLTIRVTATGDFLGMATLQSIDTAAPRMGVWMREGAQGKGYGREAARAALDWIGTTLGVEAVHCPVVAGDIPSRRLAEALGGAKGETTVHRKATGVELRVMDFRIPVAAAKA